MIRNLLGAVVLLLTCFGNSSSQTTAFTYQGRLTDGGNPTSGSFQMQFKLFDALAAGTQIGSTLNDVPVTATGGTFTVQLDFGSSPLTGANRWLEIAVRRNSGESYVTLSPREQIASSPYAVRTVSAAVSDDSLKLGGVNANQFVQTTDPRLSDARNPLPGSGSYIQNTSSPQAATNFNISGNGTVGGNTNVGGRVGIGTTTPASKLEISGGADQFSEGPSFSMRNIFGNRRFEQMVTSDGKWYFSVLPLGAGQGRTAMVVDLTSTAARLGLGTTPNTGLTLGWSEPWTVGQWRAQMDLSNIGAIGWNINSQGNRFGIGQADNGFYIFRTSSPFGSTSTPASFSVSITNSGNVGIGMPDAVTDAQRLLHVNGRARVGSIPLEASTAQVCFNAGGDLLQCGASSRKLKDNVRPFTLGLDTISRLRPINFNWKEGGAADIGLGAEDVAGVAPELALRDADGNVAGVKYDKLNIVLINAVKEQQKQIEELRTELKAQKKIISRLQARRTRAIRTRR